MYVHVSQTHENSKCHVTKVKGNWVIGMRHKHKNRKDCQSCEMSGIYIHSQSDKCLFIYLWWTPPLATPQVLSSRLVFFIIHMLVAFFFSFVWELHVALDRLNITHTSCLWLCVALDPVFIYEQIKGIHNLTVSRAKKTGKLKNWPISVGLFPGL